MTELGPFWEKKIRSYFRRLDFDGDGKVSKKDYDILGDRYVELGKLDGVREKQVRRKLSKFWDEFFRAYEVYGEIEEDEYIGVVRKQEKKISPTAGIFFYTFFELMDLNGDGTVQKDEFNLFFKVFKLDEGTAAETFKMLDTNGDGLLTEDEFVTAGREFFTSNDESLPSKHIFGPLI